VIAGADITSSQSVNATLRNTKTQEDSERQSDENSMIFDRSRGVRRK